MEHDAIIIGAGPAGLNAALVLARCTRDVRIFDAGRPRNAASRHLHNFLTRDGLNPRRFLELARKEVLGYGVRVERGVVCSASRTADGFLVQTDDERRMTSRTLLLATGVVDQLPDILNAKEFYGKGLYHCPYCDAWPHRGTPLAALGEPRHALGLAKSLLTWSADVTMLTDGARASGSLLLEAKRLGIRVASTKISAFRTGHGRQGFSPRDRLGMVAFADGTTFRTSAVFFNTSKLQRSQLAQSLGCMIKEDGGVLHDRRQRTGVPGLYVAGDASFDVQFVIVAAAEGAKAGVAMNRYLQELRMSSLLANEGRKTGLEASQPSRPRVE